MVSNHKNKLGLQDCTASAGFECIRKRAVLQGRSLAARSTPVADVGLSSRSKSRLWVESAHEWAVVVYDCPYDLPTHF